MIALRSKITSAPSGVTLTEVLMSMMIMSIGVASVATLFPIAALRSAQATKSTNAAILKYKVEAQLKTLPSLIYDPDGDFDPLASPTAASGQPALREHFSNANNRNYIIDPVGYFNTFIAPPDTTATPVQYAASFGNTINGSQIVPANLLQRFDAGIVNANGGLSPEALRAIAIDLTKLGDSWETVVDEVAEGVLTGGGGNVIGVELPEDVDLTDMMDVDSEGYFSRLGYDPENTRVTVFSVNGQFSESFPVTQVSGPQQVRWSEEGLADFNNSNSVDLRYLSAVFGGNVGRVLVQLNRTNDFNWVLTVRRGADGRTSGVDVVVLYNDGISADDERVYETPGPNEFNGTAGIQTQETFCFRSGDNDISVPSVTADGLEPFIKRGGFVLDVDNARWYRVSDYEDDPQNSGFTRVVLESPAAANSPANIGHAIFLPTIIDVFPLGSLPAPDVLRRNF